MTRRWPTRWHVHLSSDPYFNLERREMTLLSDLGLTPNAYRGWEELEDFEVYAPMRPVINGRQDYTSPPDKSWHQWRVLDDEEIWARDLVSAYTFWLDLGHTDLQPSMIGEWSTRYRDFPAVMGYKVVDRRGKRRHDELYYDRADLYEWMEKHYPKYLER